MPADSFLLFELGQSSLEEIRRCIVLWRHQDEWLQQPIDEQRELERFL